NNLYVTDVGNHVIVKITSSGISSVIAGNGTKGTVNGPATTAEFNNPLHIVIDASNILYVSDGKDIRKITPDGIVSEFAGSADVIDGLTIDATWNIYASIYNCILKITSSGIMSRLVSGSF